MVAVFDFTFFPGIKACIKTYRLNFYGLSDLWTTIPFLFFMSLFTRYAKRFERISSRDYDQLIKEL